MAGCGCSLGRLALQGLLFLSQAWVAVPSPPSTPPSHHLSHLPGVLAWVNGAHWLLGRLMHFPDGVGEVAGWDVQGSSVLAAMFV